MNGWKRMDDDPSIKKGVDKPKSADFEGNGRMDEESAENKKGADLEYEYSEDE